MILYFSGTGNSQWAARRLAEALDDEVVSINCIMKEGTSAPLRSRKPFVFVAPTYAWRLPRVVDRWIRGASFAGSNDAYFVLTCGGSVGNAAAYAPVSYTHLRRQRQMCIRDRASGCAFAASHRFSCPRTTWRCTTRRTKRSAAL